MAIKRKSKTAANKELSFRHSNALTVAVAHPVQHGGHVLVALQTVQNDASFSEQPHILLRVDDPIHQFYVPSENQGP
ncbi:hypothetical protein OIU76_004777 [Salix suchowensis]|nr:hypothetical protein OIU76_004777 [Salix suchowensis]